MAAPLLPEENPIEEIVAHAGQIAVLPQVVFKIMELSGSETATATDLERAISVDPGFSAKVLSQVNTAYYSLPTTVTSIKDAIMFLGLSNVRQLTMSLGVFDAFFGKNDKGSLRKRTWWKHSVDTAVAARAVAQNIRVAGIEETYACGLLHFLGKSILERYSSDTYEKVAFLTEKGVPDVQAETHLFKCNHVQVGMAVAESWGFPEILIQGLNYHDTPEPGEQFVRIRACVNFGHSIAVHLTNGNNASDFTSDQLPEWVIQSLNIKPDKFLSLTLNSEQAIQAASAEGF